MKLTNEDLDRLDEIEAAATPGPWQADNLYVLDECERSLLGGEIWSPVGDANAVLVAEARNALRPLIEEVRRLRARQVEILRRAQGAESALREKVRAVDAPHDSRSLGRRMLGGALMMVEDDVERLRDAIKRTVDLTDMIDPRAAEMLRELVEETGTNPVERATDQFKRGEEQAIVRRYRIRRAKR